MKTATLTELDQLVVLRCLKDDHRRIGRDILNAACLWADSHPWLGDLFTYPEDDPSVLGVAGEGTPRVDISSVAEFAAAMGLPTKTGVRLIGDALELRHRLPRLWEAVQNLAVSADQARRVAARTTGLSRDDARAADLRLVGCVDRVGAAQLERLVERVKEQVAPAEPSDPRSDDRHFTIVHDTTTASGRSFVTGILDLPDALDLDAAIGDGAALQKFWGNNAPLRVRRAQAAGDLARHQSLLPAPLDAASVHPVESKPLGYEADPRVDHDLSHRRPLLPAPVDAAAENERACPAAGSVDSLGSNESGRPGMPGRIGAVIDAPPRRERASSQSAHFREPDREIFEHLTPVDAPPDPIDAQPDPDITPTDEADRAWHDEQHAEALAAEQAEHRAECWQRRLQYPPPEPVLTSSGPFRPPASRQIVLYLHLSSAAITGATTTSGHETPVPGDMTGDGAHSGSMPNNGIRGTNMPENGERDGSASENGMRGSNVRKNGGCDGSMSAGGSRDGGMSENAMRGMLSSDTVGTVGNTLSAVTAQQIREWCAAPGAQVTVRPVIDLNEPASTDTYQPTPRMREQIQLTNPQCVFPWCAANAIRADLDHIEPWRGRPAVNEDDKGELCGVKRGSTHTDEAAGSGAAGGPPNTEAEAQAAGAAGGPTHTDNLAPLCRSHHRLKTHYGWRYERTGPTSFTWTSPAGETYHRHGPLTHQVDLACSVNMPRAAATD